MPPLSDYTPFESLLFFQSLATLNARPASFVAISDVLRNNPFVRENADFNAERLSPEALEELYTTLMREWLENGGGFPVSSIDQNGSNNPKKRKITSPRADGLVDAASHATIVPELVSHLYARYKEIATKEISHEEQRYQEIRNEIERLQKEGHEAPGPPVAQDVAQQAARPVSVPTAKEPEPAPEPMDVDVEEPDSVQQPGKDIGKCPIAATVGTGDTRLQAEPPKEPSAPQPPPAQPVVEQPQAAPGPVQQPTQPGPPQLPTAIPPELRPIDGKAAAPAQQPTTGPQPTPKGKAAANVPSEQQVQPPVVTPHTGAARTQPVPPRQVQQVGQSPVASPAQPSIPSTKPAGKPSPAAFTPAKAPKPPHTKHFQQWPGNQSPHTPHPHIPPYTSTPLAKQSVPGRPAFISPHPQQTPQLQASRPYPGNHPPPVPITPGQIPSGAQTPLPTAQGYKTPNVPGPSPSVPLGQNRPLRLSIDTPGSLTPWKKTPRLSIDIPESPGSPVRPRPEDVSPISERAPSPIEAPEAPQVSVESRRKGRPAERKGPKSVKDPTVAETGADGKAGPTVKTEKTSLSLQKRRDRSTTSSRSRGRSVTSRDEVSPADSRAGAHGRIKHEVSEDAEPEPRTVGRRKGTAAPVSTDDQPSKGRPKRKRGASESLEREPPHPEPSRLDNTQYVLCTRNFPRTGAPIMNDVTMHKHASIFTKPLTERDAPGYRDLIYRPQDLKTIKSAIHQGSKAVTAATEAANTPVTDGESPVPTAGTPSKNAVLMLQKTEDVIPPKGIVNSTQLEKELIRMFANAIMFNPIPQRGFGPAFPMISERGSRESTLLPEVDEGGIIKDTQEMFEDVEQAVTRWRAAERTADELANKSILALRRGSASEFNTDSTDEAKG